MSETADPERTDSAAVALRVAGAAYSDIAAALGYAGELQAREAVENNLARRAASLSPEERDRQRTIASARVDRLLQSVWRKATDPADAEHLPAVRVALALVDRHARLWGADAPTEHLVITPTAGEIDNWVRAMLERGDTSMVTEPDIIIIPGEVEGPDVAATG